MFIRKTSKENYNIKQANNVGKSNLSGFIKYVWMMYRRMQTEKEYQIVDKIK